MRLLDRFRKKQSEKNQIHEETNNELPFDIEFSIMPDGCFKIEFFDKQADFKQFYDVTRLIVNPKTINICGESMHNCLISWYGNNDAIMFDENGRDIGNRSQYKRILVGINLELLRKDPEYCSILMKGLLNKKRVEEYLNRGLQENPDIPCGIYVGEIIKTSENNYRKYFSNKVGMMSHNSGYMVNKRNEKRKAEEERKHQLRALTEEKIKKLQEELEELQ